MNYDTLLMIGMSGAGKTTVGKLIAQSLSFSFVDVDDVIEATLTGSIQEYLDQHGDNDFLSLEEQTLLSLPITSKLVISPGGSIVYSEPVMKRFKERAFIIYLYDSAERIKERIPNIESRGIVGSATKTYDEIYAERAPLYERYSDMIVNCSQFSSFEDIAAFIIEQRQLLCESKL